jgi:hypothetical protein
MSFLEVKSMIIGRALTRSSKGVIPKRARRRDLIALSFVSCRCKLQIDTTEQGTNYVVSGPHWCANIQVEKLYLNPDRTLGRSSIVIRWYLIGI